jgi:hypothetical protein
MNQPVDVAFVITSVILGYVVVTTVLAAILYIIFSTEK